VADTAKLSKADAIVLVTKDTKQTLPFNLQNLLANYEIRKSFAVVDSVFRFQTIVTVYHNKAKQPELT
jgi:hypothetical protein